MTPEQFVYWLQGFVEIHGEPPSISEWTIIKDHLQTVFKKETPLRVGPGIAAPAYPTWPNPIAPFTTPNYPRPEIICQVGV